MKGIQVYKITEKDEKYRSVGINKRKITVNFNTVKIDKVYEVFVGCIINTKLFSISTASVFGKYFYSVICLIIFIAYR